MGSKSTKSQKRHPKLKETRILITQEQDIKDTILILGIGETGKSTVSKQFNFLFNPNEKIRSEDYFRAIRKSILGYLKDLIDIATELKLLIQNEEVVKLMGSYELPLTIDSKTYPLLHDKFIDPLWSLVEIKEAYERRDEYQLTERAKYFLDKSDLFVKDNYQVTIEDILYYNMPTTGLNGIKICFDNNKNNQLMIIDVSGNRSERRKWVHCYRTTRLIIYVVCISDFNRVLYENNEVNRLKESLELFEVLIKTDRLSDIPFVILYNKDDLLKNKLNTFNVHDYFEEYTGNNEYEDVLNYFMGKFREIYGKRQNVHSYIINAINSEQMKSFFEWIYQILYNEELSASKK